MLKPATAAYFTEYIESHQHPTNRLTHKIAIPVIVLHVMAMLDWVRLLDVAWLPGGALTLGEVVFAAVAVWYLRMEVKLGLLVLLFAAACIPLGRLLPWPVVVGLAVLGWVVQLAGHVIWEKKSPSFLTNLAHALVGPMFLAAMLTRDVRPDGNGSLKVVGISPGDPVFASFAEFWPFYLSEHSNRTNRVLHFVGSTLGLVQIVIGAFTGHLLLVGAGIATGYGFAWFGHFVIERNRPASFRYPLWSFIADWKMWALMLTGRLGVEQPRRAS
jgi:hypothetical protein